MKSKALLFLLTLFSLKGYSDSAQPGVWGAGGTRDFMLLYPEDSNAYKKIQMKKEFVSIQLYKGYAVVKGEYWMYNTTNDTFQIRTGYPLNSSIEAENMPLHCNIVLDSLVQLQVFTDSMPAKIISTPGDFQMNKRVSEYYNGSINWYVWITKFKPHGYTKIDVYFIVNTNNTHITGGGYGRADYNGFIYILESGSTWMQPIDQGTILVQLMNEMKITEVHGVKPDSIFTYNEQNNIIKCTFSNLSPTPENNIIITYSNAVYGFDFPSIIKNKQNLFQSVNMLSHTQLEGLAFKSLKFKSPVDVPEGTNPMIYFLLLIIGGILAGTTIIVLVIIWITKLLRK